MSGDRSSGVVVRQSAGHGEMKRRIAEIVGCDPSRYASGTGTERHKRLTAREVRAIADHLGLGFVRWEYYV